MNFSAPIFRSALKNQRAAYSSVARSTLKSPLTASVVAHDDRSQAAALTFAVAAGSRFETSSNRGIAHHLKNWAFQDTTNRTALRIARETEILGGSLSATLTREHLFLTAEFLRKDLNFFLDLLADATYNALHHSHQSGRINKLIAEDSQRAAVDPETVIDEALHKLAFRSGLGNSLFALPGSIDSAAVKSFGQGATSFGSKVAIAGAGLDAAELSQAANAVLAKHFVAGTGAENATSTSKYFGGEARIDASSDQGHVTIAYPTGATNSAANLSAHILKAYLGGLPSVQYGVGASPFAKLGDKTSSSILAFSYGFSDAGLLGAHVKTVESSSPAEAAKGVVEEIKKAGESISAEAFKGAVARAKLDAINAFESKAAQAEALGAQALTKGDVLGPAEILAKLDAVKAADVSKLAATMLKSKPSLVVYGNSLALPYADSL